MCFKPTTHGAIFRVKSYARHLGSNQASRAASNFGMRMAMCASMLVFDNRFGAIFLRVSLCFFTCIDFQDW